MRMTTDMLLTALREQVGAAVPEAEHYKGRLEEGFSRPALYYFPIYQSEQRANVFTSKRTIEIQLLYYGTTDEYGREDFEERLRVQTAMEGIFSQGCLSVGDRWLPLVYEMKEADEKLACYLTFQFYDEAIFLQTAEDAAMEPAENMEMETHVTGA